MPLGMIHYPKMGIYVTASSCLPMLMLSGDWAVVTPRRKTSICSLQTTIHSLPRAIQSHYFATNVWTADLVNQYLDCSWIIFHTNITSINHRSDELNIATSIAVKFIHYTVKFILLYDYHDLLGSTSAN